jgi:hypothetical protein
VLLLSDALCFAGSPGYLSQASEVTRYIQHNFYDQGAGLYHHSITDKNAEFMWGNGVIFPALVGACRYEPNLYRPIMSRFFKAMDRYWDSKANPPGYEPSPTNGNGHDKYYDDNEWMVITFTEAYELTRDTRYLDRANAALKFSLSGWDDQLGGGIWWHEGHKGDSKNTCSNGPAAFACLRMEKYLPAAQAAADQAAAIKIIKWTTEHLQASDGLYGDNQNVTTEKKNGGKLTYNTALMIRAQLALYRWTGNHQYLLDAQRSAKAGDWFLDKKTKAFRDDIKFAHLMVEADLDLYRTTHEDYLLKRAADNAAFYYQAWKEKPSPELIENAALARILWLMADTESDTGKQFWAKADAVRN